ncbi:MAG TPA: 4-hydroxy-tetrahydrodipicolinate synthase [Acidimicrobiales bacterium]|nr:4-hydroxy-tetrahydrodipicolinate synthase [Acidimicrobiales bacterium]
MSARIPGRFGAVLTAMVTPFDLEGRVDLDAVGALARWLADNGNDGLVVTGTTGESPVLTDQEKADVWRAACEAVTIPIIAGAGTNDTAHSIELTKIAEAAGAAGILAVTPYYSRPSQAGLYAHFAAVAGATSLPVMLYDIPIRTGREIQHDTFVRLTRDVPNILANKDAKKDPAAAARLLRDAPEAFEVYSGDSSFTLPLLAVGASGIVGVASHWSGRAQQEMIAAFASGDTDRAREINAQLLSSYDFEGADDHPNPIPTKVIMNELGVGVGECRLPMGPPPDGLAAQARALLDSLGPLAPNRLAP